MTALSYPAAPRMPAVAQILARYDRPRLEAFITIAVDLLDAFDGDPDVELNGDETDNMGSEEDFDPNRHYSDGPGCLISDPDEAIDDGPCDDINNDHEHDEWIVPSYGVDQSSALACRAGVDVVVNYECGDAVKRPPRDGR
jgi:hypothetical protein